MAELLTDAQVLEAVRLLERGRGGLSFARRENRDLVFEVANGPRGTRGSARRLPVFRSSSVCRISDHYVYDLFAADLGLANEKSTRKLYHLTGGHGS